MKGSVLVIGGGIAGIQTTLDLTELGFKVYLVEKKPSIGGRMAQFDRLFPFNDCSLCVLAPKMVMIYKNPNVELITCSEIQDVSGVKGDFKVKIIKKPRYVDESKCRGCGECASKCPKIEVPNLFDMNLGKRKSIYIPFPQAIPPVYVIDPELCLYLNRKVCGVCQKVCKGDAVDFEQKSEFIEINVGAIVVATGFTMLGNELASKWGYQYKNVLNALEYERMLCPTGPFGGYILRPSDEQEPMNITFIQCAGSGYLRDNIPYCSRVCCMYTTKNAIITKKRLKNSQISILRHNIRVFGKNFYEYTKNAQEEYEIQYKHAKVNSIKEDTNNNDLIINYEDLTTKELEKHRTNLVVLAAPLVPSEGTKYLGEILKIELDENNFFKEKSYLNKFSSTREGIYLAGFCQGPMNISETVADASAVASQIAALLNSVRYSEIEEKEVDILPEEEIIKIIPKALIIGGGIAGITAALNISNQGYETFIIEREDKLGGNLNYIDILYPINVKASDLLNQFKEKIESKENITLLLNSKIKNISGSIGNYKITIIDSNNKEQEVIVGILIVATGGKEYKPYGLYEYNESNKNIITLLELEQNLKKNDKEWLKNINHITTIMCANARIKEGFSYCSNICCTNTIKSIDQLKKLKPELEINVLFRDLHMAKKQFEDITSKRKKIANYLRYSADNIPEVKKINDIPEKYEITVLNINNKSEKINFKSDLIILATPIIPPEGIVELANLINVPLDDHGFFIEAHAKLRPLDFETHGIFICGCAQWPKNVQDTISQANGAAGRASRFLSIKGISTTKLEFLSFLLSIECYFKDMIVNVEKCNGCGQCVDACIFKAIDLTDVKKEFEDISISMKKAHINPAICKGCGKCASTCRLKAIDARHYDFDQISSIIDPYFLEKAKSKEEIIEI